MISINIEWTSNPLLTHFLTHMIARGRNRLPEITKFVAYYKKYEFGIIRDYGRLFEITNDYAKIIIQLRF